MLQKVIKVGNSLGVTLPREFVVKNKIKRGTLVSAAFSTPVSEASKYEMVADGEFTELIKEVDSRYGPALEELADLP